MNKKTTVKKSVSLRNDVFRAAEQEADKYFGGNFSAYLTYLICADRYGVTRNVDTEEVISKEKVVDSITHYTKSKENEDYINSMLDL